MGCWNATCCLSNLPISYGQEIYVWLIAPIKSTFAGDMAGNCYTNDMYYPISYAIEGKYNDYGGIENVKLGLSADYVESLFDKEILTYTTDAVKRDKAQSPIDWSMQTIERGKAKHCDDLKVDLFVVRKDVVNGLYNISDTIIDKHYSKLQDDIMELCKPDSEYKDSVDRAIAEMGLYTNRFLRVMTDINHSYLMDKQARNTFVEFMKGRTLSDSDMGSLMLTVRTQFILHTLRKCWCPQPSGVGSQAWDIREMKHFCGVVASICDKELKGH